MRKVTKKKIFLLPSHSPKAEEEASWKRPLGEELEGVAAVVRVEARPAAVQRVRVVVLVGRTKPS